MSMINDTHQFVFLHVAKTGGRSIQLSLQKRFGREGVFHTGNIDLDINRLGRMLGLEAKALAGDEKWRSYFTFAFVRNPWDRAVSMFEHMSKDFRLWRSQPNSRPSGKAIMQYKILKLLVISAEEFTFERFMLDVIRDRVFDNYHWDKQTNALTDGIGNVIFDFVGRFERLQEDFDFACRQIAVPTYHLPHHHKSERRNWESYYTPSTRKILVDTYAEDIELFRYG